MLMFELPVLVGIAGTFFIAGTVKGVIGLGLPSISLAFLTVLIDLPSAMALLLVPSFVTNLWQAFEGGAALVIFKRLWPFLLMATGTVWVGALAINWIDPALLSGFLGALLVAYAVLNSSEFKIKISRRNEIWTGPLFGAANGLFGGMTGSFVAPGVMFLQALKLSRHVFVQAMGILFMASTLALALALQNNNLLNAELGVLSATSLLPAVLGMVFGQKIRGLMSESVFRRTFYFALFILGAYIMVNAIFEYSV